jgi:hypothetical protein
MFRYYQLAGILLIALHLSIPLPVSSQILYTDVNPDVTVKAPENPPFAAYNVDMNMDGKGDIKLEHFAPDPSSMAVEVFSWPDDVIEAILVDSHNGRPSALPEGFEITMSVPQKEFICTYNGHGNAALFVNYSSSLTEEWDTDEDRYLGIAVVVDGDVHYGWIHISTPPNASSFTIKGYALEMTPGAAILAGDKGVTDVDPPEKPVLDVNIYSTGRSIVVDLPGSSAVDATLTLYTILGAHAGEYVLSQAKSTINLPNARSGAYAAVVRQGLNVKTKMLVLW